MVSLMCKQYGVSDVYTIWGLDGVSDVYTVWGL
jgi:hypothetical protein